MLAAIDLGSNGFRLHIGYHDGTAMRIIKTAREPFRLATGLDADGNLHATTMHAACARLTHLRSLLQPYAPQTVRAVGTHIFRVANNAAQFLPAAAQALGYPIDILSGEEEGRLIDLGVASEKGPSARQRLIIDIGGGSTECIVGRGDDRAHVVTLPIGTFAIGETYFPNGQIVGARFAAAIDEARQQCARAAPQLGPTIGHTAFGSGTLRAIADILQHNRIGDGKLSLANLTALQARLMRFGHCDRIRLTDMGADRARVLLGGVAIGIGALQAWRVPALHPIAAGLRMGLLWDLYLRSSKQDRRPAASTLASLHCADPAAALTRPTDVSRDDARFLAMAPPS